MTQKNVDIFIPFLMDNFYPNSAFNMVEILEKTGCNVRYNTEQTGTGMSLFVKGYVKEAKEIAKKFINDFQYAEAIICPSKAEVYYIKKYFHTFFKNIIEKGKAKKIQEKTYEFSNYLVNVVKQTKFGTWCNYSAVYLDPSFVPNHENDFHSPRELLDQVEDLVWKECHPFYYSSGIDGGFSFDYPTVSAELLSDQVKWIIEKAKVDFVVSTDVLPLFHIDSYIKKYEVPLKTMHIADILNFEA